MPDARRCALVTARVATVAAVMAVAACGGDADPMSDPGDKPEAINAEPKQVDVCQLVRPADIELGLGLVVREVSLQYTAAQVPTLACGFGAEFGVPQVSVQLATGPISFNVFEDAYGVPAGGDPEPVKRLGDSAYFRNEPEGMEIHALVNGAILTVDVATDKANPATKRDVVDLARLAADGLPANPRLAPTSAGAHCTRAPDDAITEAIGTGASVTSSLADDDGSLMCSWAARPGSVVVTVVRSPERVASYRRLLDDNLYAPVDEVEGKPDTLAVSRTDKAGDLLIFDGDRALAVVNVVPTAGFSDPEVATTPGEIALANGIVERLL